MEFYKTIPKKVINENTRERYKIINNKIIYGNSNSTLFRIIEKHENCKKCKFFVVCNLVLAKKEIQFCTIEECENGYYKGERMKIYTEEDSLKQILNTFKKEDLKIVNSEIYNNKMKMNSANFQFIKKLWNADCAKCKNVENCGTYYSYGEKEIKNVNCILNKTNSSFDKVIVKKYGF